MTRFSLLLFVCLMLVATPLLLAQDPPPPTGPVEMQVQLRPQTGDQPRRIAVGPRAAGVCPRPIDCSDHFTIRWTGNALDGEKIRIRFLDPAAAGKCLDPVDFTIDGRGQPNAKTVTLRSPRPECPPKAFFFFEISCEGGQGGNCGGVEPVDPGAMVDGPPG